MYCAYCGAKVESSQKFCDSCGKPVETVAGPPQEGRVEKHVRILGILWLVISGLRLIPGFFLLVFNGVAMPFLPVHVREILVPLAALLGIIFVGGAIIGLVAGWGLHEYRPWARILALVLGVLALVDFPFGTALGIYTLWVLLPSRAEYDYNRLSRTA